MPKTIAAGLCLMPSTTSSSGVASTTSGRFSRRLTSDTGSTEVVGSAVPDWKTPRSACPRCVSSDAVRFSPAPTESRATIVPTPRAIPIAVAAVRAL